MRGLVTLVAVMAFAALTGCTTEGVLPSLAAGAKPCKDAGANNLVQMDKFGHLLLKGDIDGDGTTDRIYTTRKGTGIALALERSGEEILYLREFPAATSITLESTDLKAFCERPQSPPGVCGRRRSASSCPILVKAVAGRKDAFYFFYANNRLVNIEGPS